MTAVTETAASTVLAELYAGIADDIAGRVYPTFPAFRAGPEVWRAAHQAAATLYVHAAMEGLARHLKIDQVQFWDADKTTALATLRDLADGHEQRLDDLRQAGDTRRILHTCAVLRRGLGIDGRDGSTLAELADWAGRRIRQLELETEQLRGEIERLKAATR